MVDVIDQERQHRHRLWASIVEQGGPSGVAPELLRSLGIYGGAQGIWGDKARTKELTDARTGVTVGLLHTGSSYADDLARDGVLYHYPKTNRSAGRDKGEIDATKAAGEVGLPVFVIAYPSPASTKRDVQLGWIEGWEDEAGLFLITFGKSRPLHLWRGQLEDDEPFMLTEKRASSSQPVNVRSGQARFKFRVFQRYGAQCAACGIAVPELLDAAHIKPKKDNGSDDPRNGLVLCATHPVRAEGGRGNNFLMPAQGQGVFASGRVP